MEVSFFINMLVATALAIIIGLERELSGHKGSIKTNILITLGACIFVSYEKLTGIVDDDRIAASIVTGVGFLCSGFIFKNGLSVTGLGTASTLWCSAAVGVLCAGGHIKEAVIATAFLFSLNVIISLIQPKIKPLKMFDDTKIDVVYSQTKDGERPISVQNAIDIIMARVDEIIKLFNHCSNSLNAVIPTYSPIYLTGECAQMVNGLQSYLAKKLNRNIKLLVPSVPKYNNSEFSSLISIISVANEEEKYKSKTFWQKLFGN